MSASVLANELSTLISESKRKNNELRNAAEKSLQELKALPATSEQQLAADLSRRSTFVDPFLIACQTKNARFATSGVICLQRLIILKGLPKARLQDALEALHSCIDLSLDVQLKILQGLPSLLQNYADDLRGDLLSAALRTCAALQVSKVQTVSGVAAATLQQLVTSVFEKVEREDEHASRIQPVTEVAGDNGQISLRPAAFDAYRVFRDLVLVAEGRKPRFVDVAALSPEGALDLVRTIMEAHPQLFGSHQELLIIMRSNLIQMVIRGLSEKLSFAMTTRLCRILDLSLNNYFADLPAELEVALGLATHMLEPDSAPMWKRVLLMEVLQRFFANTNLAIDAFAAFDQPEGGKAVIQDIISAFVRLSTEKPSVIGLGQQSTFPTGPSSQQDMAAEQTTLEAAGGVAGIISSALGVVESNVAGMSNKWSVPRNRCLDQLDKTDAPTLPESYIYSLVLDCLNSLSDNLAKAVLPLTVSRDKPKAKSDEENGQEVNGATAAVRPSNRTQRSQSFRQRAVPLNPLDLEGKATFARVQTIAALIDSCWPAVLATSSTFFNAALDEQYYRSLIKSFQRFAQVAGLLRLKTPRDALLTMLGKSAVPPHVLNSATAPIEGMRSPVAESPRVFSNPRSLLSVDSLVSQATSLSIDKERRGSFDPSRPTLTVRNLLCLRALLNLAIALGPAMDSAIEVVVDTLRQADMVLSSSPQQQVARQAMATAQKGNESPNIVQAFSTEVYAVEAAASRLLESTADYPNDAFVKVLNTFCRLLQDNTADAITSPQLGSDSPPPTPSLKKRTFSGLPGLHAHIEMQARDYQFVIPKLITLAELNISRFVYNDPAESGWDLLVGAMSTIAIDAESPRDARRAATDLLCMVAADSIAEVSEEEDSPRVVAQRRAFAVLLRLMTSLYERGDELGSTDVEIQGRIIEATKEILENAGDSMLAGWNKCIAILSSAFQRSERSPLTQDYAKTTIDWANISPRFVAVQLGRVAFAAVQLICSDFLRLVPQDVGTSLVELLHRFTLQKEDLNMALTSVTMSWHVSDFFLDKVSRDDLETQIRDEETSIARQTAEHDTWARQWLFSLTRLKDAISESSGEVRKAAFHTMCNVFKAHGARLSPAAWDLTLRSVILRILDDDVQLYQAQDSARQEIDVSAILIEGISSLFAQYLGIIESAKGLDEIWETITKTFSTYVSFASHSINAAVYSGLAKILDDSRSDSAFWEAAAYRTASLWSSSPPQAVSAFAEKRGNQDSFSSYARAAAQIYRLTRPSLNLKQIQTITDNMYRCIEQSDGPLYGADVHHMSPLQERVLAILKNMRMDIDGVAEHLLEVGSRLLQLPVDANKNEGKPSGPTFVALAGEAIDWTKDLILMHFAQHLKQDSTVIATALTSLARVIASKYTLKGKYKGVALSRHTTNAALELSQPLLGSTEAEPASARVASFVRIVEGVIYGGGTENVPDEAEMYDDENFDIASFNKLCDAVVPHLGNESVAAEAIQRLTRALFDASIIHAPEQGELPSRDQSPLLDLEKIRRGRIKDVPFAERERMSYVCWKKLIQLSSQGADKSDLTKVSQAAAPLLVLRLAIPIRAYIADQPLRGRKPQPLSELEELLFCFEQIRELKCDPHAFAADPLGGEVQGKQAHLRFLYPLLIRALATAGDKWSGAEEVFLPLQATLEALNRFS